MELALYLAALLVDEASSKQVAEAMLVPAGELGPGAGDGCCNLLKQRYGGDC